MTVQEMSDAVLMKLDKSASYAVAAFEDEDILYWLNVSQNQIIKDKVFGSNTNPAKYGEGLKRMQDLSPLVQYSSKLSYGTELLDHAYHPNVAYVDIDTYITDFLYYVGSDVLIDDPNAPTDTLPQESMLVEESVIGKLISTPYNKPVLRQCYIYLKEGEVNVIYDPFATLDSIYVSYIRKPDTLVTATPDDGETNECELPEHVHDEIVNLTVYLMLENIESQRQQTQFLTINKNE
jgi:hypothetical protein